MDNKNEGISQYRLIADMKKYLKIAEECDSSTLNSLISETKTFIYDNEILKEEYEKYLKQFEDIRKQEYYNHYIADFCDKMQTLFKKFNNPQIQFHSGQDPNSLYFSYFNWYYPDVKEQVAELKHFLFDEENGGIFEAYLYIAEHFLEKKGTLKRSEWVPDLKNCFVGLRCSIKQQQVDFYFLQLENKYYDFLDDDILLVLLFRVALVRTLKYFINYIKKNSEISLKNINSQKNVSLCLDMLTKRQQEVAKEIKEGLSRKEIAKIMKVEETTVQTHINAIGQKLDCSGMKEIFKILKKS